MGAEEVVIDASAAIAFLNREPGGERLQSYLPQSWMSAVNAAEVFQILRRHGYDPDRGLHILREIGLRIVDADLGAAQLAGNLERETRSVGLSLGDRFCFALALERRLTLVTTDRAFAKVRLPVAVVLLR